MRGLGEFQQEQMHSARNEEIVKLADSQDPPMSYEQIGRRYGLTKQRVAQIVRQDRKRSREVASQPS